MPHSAITSHGAEATPTSSVARPIPTNPMIEDSRLL